MEIEMRRYFTKAQAEMIEDILDQMHDRIQELSAIIIQGYAPTLWLDFLNADPQDPESMWPVYRGYVKFVQLLRTQNDCSKDIKEAKLLTKAEFLERYPVELQADAEKLHRGMKEVIDEGKTHVIASIIRYIGEDAPVPIKKPAGDPDQIREILTKGAYIPPESFTIGLEWPDQDNQEYGYLVSLHTPGINQPNFWLSIIYTGMTTQSYNPEKDAIIVRRCEAPDCRKYFLPAPHGRGQRYHSKSCRSRHNMQKRRQAK